MRKETFRFCSEEGLRLIIRLQLPALNPIT